MEKLKNSLSLCIGLINQNAFAQDVSIARGFMLKVKQGEGPKFEEAFKKHLDWRKSAGDPWTWSTFQVVNSQNLGYYLVRSGGHTWSDIDNYTPFMVKSNPEFNKTVAPYLESVTSTISRTDTEHRNWFANNDDMNLISVGVYHIKPGKVPDMTAVLTKYHETVKAHNYPANYSFVWSLNGSIGQVLSIVTPLRNWAEMAGPEETLLDFLNRTVGTMEAREMGEQFNGSYEWMESMVYAFRRDLSIMN